MGKERERLFGNGCGRIRGGESSLGRVARSCFLCSLSLREGLPEAGERNDRKIETDDFSMFDGDRIIWFGTPRYSSSSLLPTDPPAFTRPGENREQCKTPYDLDSYQVRL